MKSMECGLGFRDLVNNFGHFITSVLHNFGRALYLNIFSNLIIKFKTKTNKQLQNLAHIFIILIFLPIFSIDFYSKLLASKLKYIPHLYQHAGSPLVYRPIAVPRPIPTGSCI